MKFIEDKGYLVASIGFILAGILNSYDGEGVMGIAFIVLGCSFFILYLKAREKKREEEERGSWRDDDQDSSRDQESSDSQRTDKQRMNNQKVGFQEVEDDPEFQEFMAKGQKIGAIKRCRVMTGCGLKEAKDFVDGL